MNKAKEKIKSVFLELWNDYSVMFVCFIIIAVCSILAPGFLRWSNFMTILRNCSAIGIIALGMTIVIISGGIDLSVGSNFAICGVIMIVLQKNGVPLAFCILVSCLFGMTVGLINGTFIAYFNLPPFIVTLATQTLLRSIVQYITNGSSIAGQRTPFLHTVGNGSIAGNFPVPFVIFLGLAIIMHIVLSRTKFGTYTYAIGGNELAARYTGIKVEKSKILTYMLCGLMVSLASLVEVSRMVSVSPTVSGINYELEAVIATVVGGTAFSGGKGKIPGTIIGAIILYIITNILIHLNVSTFLSGAVKGFVILAAVLLQKREKLA